MPTSPCIASTGCRNNAADPVLQSVAAIFLAIKLDFPKPSVIILPLFVEIASHALSKLLSKSFKKQRICKNKKFQEKFDGDDEDLKDKLMKESEMVLLSENLKQNKI